MNLPSPSLAGSVERSEGRVERTFERQLLNTPFPGRSFLATDAYFKARATSKQTLI